MDLAQAREIATRAIADGSFVILPQPELTQAGEPRKLKKTKYGIPSNTTDYRDKYQRDRREKFKAAGLTARGTVRKRCDGTKISDADVPHND